jgi:putative transposase
VVKEFEKILLAEAENFHCDILVYLFMPDHCHILLEGKDEQSNVLKVINLFKQKTGFWLSKNRPQVYWQKDYWDHILRKEEDINTQVWYILGNPVRKELVTNLKEYLFKRSTVYNFNEWE